MFYRHRSQNLQHAEFTQGHDFPQILNLSHGMWGLILSFAFYTILL